MRRADIAAKTAAQGPRTYSKGVFYMLATCKQALFSVPLPTVAQSISIIAAGKPCCDNYYMSGMSKNNKSRS